MVEGAQTEDKRKGRDRGGVLGDYGQLSKKRTIQRTESRGQEWWVVHSKTLLS